MRSPQRANTQRRKVSKGLTLPAPVAGWFVGENLAAAPPQTAYTLDNFFPSQNYVRVRRGSVEHATGLTGDVLKLLVFDDESLPHLFAADSTKIYDVSAPGAVGAAVVTGLTAGGNDMHYVQFTTSGGPFLRVVNGTDTPLVYDGAAQTWGTTPTITGVTATSLAHVWAFKNRLYFVEEDSTSAWYLPVDSIGGAATEFPLGGVFTLGGKLLCGSGWAANLNAQTQEMCVFITTAGEVAVYTGSYPGDSAWALQGLYRIGRPLGRNCLLRAGGDLAIMTEDGIVAMSQVVQLDRVALLNKAITYNIQPAWRDAVIDLQAYDGWSITSWPIESMTIVAVPAVDTNSRYQFVANSASGAWCRYTGWDAKCFAVYDNKLWFGTSDGRVMQAETTGQDDSALYSAKMVMSYTDLKGGPNRKQIKALRPLYRTTFNAAPSFSIVADYSTTTPSPPAAAPDTASAALWDTAVWDTATWPGERTQKANWKVVTGFGAVVAPVMQVSISSTDDPVLELLQMDVLFEQGEALG